MWVTSFLTFKKKEIVKKIIEEISKTKNYEEFVEHFNSQWANI